MTVTIIENIVASFWALNHDELYITNLQDRALARHTLAYILRQRGYSLKRIGAAMRRDHTTIINSLRVAESMMETDKNFAQLFREISLAVNAAELMERAEQREHEGKVVYLSSKITGLPEEDVKKAFSTRKIMLDGAKEVIDPWQYCSERGLTGWEDCMKALIPELVRADVVYTFGNYKDSRGAVWEVAIAKAMGIKVVKFPMTLAA